MWDGVDSQNKGQEHASDNLCPLSSLTARAELVHLQAPLRILIIQPVSPGEMFSPFKTKSSLSPRQFKSCRNDDRIFTDLFLHCHQPLEKLDVVPSVPKCVVNLMQNPESIDRGSI